MCVCAFAFVYHIHIYAEITKCNEFYASIVVKQRHKHKLETCTKARKLKMQTNWEHSKNSHMTQIEAAPRQKEVRVAVASETTCLAVRSYNKSKAEIYTCMGVCVRDYLRVLYAELQYAVVQHLLSTCMCMYVCVFPTRFTSSNKRIVCKTKRN